MGQAQRDEAVDEAEASRDRTDEPAAPADEAPPAPAEGLAQAARPAGPWAGPYGRPFHPMVAAVAIGAWVCAFGFDLISQVADPAWVYARGAYVLTGAGVLAGAVAATVGLADLVRVPRGTAVAGAASYYHRCQERLSRRKRARASASLRRSSSSLGSGAAA